MPDYWRLVLRRDVTDAEVSWGAFFDAQGVAICEGGSIWERHGSRICSVLDPASLEPIWQGSLRGAASTWVGDFLLLFAASVSGPGDLAVWRLGENRVRWTCRGGGLCAVADGSVALVVSERDIECRSISTGEVKNARKLSEPIEGTEYLWSLGRILVFRTPKHLVGVEAQTGEVQWRCAVNAQLEQLALGSATRPSILPTASPTKALCYEYAGAAGLLDLKTGEFLWVRGIPMQGRPVLADGKIIYSSHGHLLVVDEATGEDVTYKPNLTKDTVWNSVALDGNVLVSVDEAGEIATIDVTTGTVLGIQREKRMKLTSPWFHQGRLYVEENGRYGGAIRVYERAGEQGASGPKRTAKKGAKAAKASSKGRPAASRGAGLRIKAGAGPHSVLMQFGPSERGVKAGTKPGNKPGTKAARRKA